MKHKYNLIKELADGITRETPILNEAWVLIEFKKELEKLKDGEKISVIINKENDYNKNP